MAESALSSVVARMSNLAVQETSFLCGVPDEITFLKDDLTSLQCFLQDADDKRRNGNASVANWVRRIRDVTYEAENIIEVAEYTEKWNKVKRGFIGAMLRYACVLNDIIARHKLGVDINRVRRRFREIAISRTTLNLFDLGETNRVQDFRSKAKYSAYSDNDDVLVGFEDDIKLIRARIENAENDQLTFISIVAMGGAGKSTLARNVYNSVKKDGLFDAFAFVSISKSFEVINVLKDIAKQVMGIEGKDKELHEMSRSDEVEESFDKIREESITTMLHNFLKQRRYLIVLDDVWTAGTWDLINVRRQVFPDMKNGSIVLLTTRNLQIAEQANGLTYVHQLKLLSKEESWHLFCRKAFPSHESIDTNHRVEFESIGKNLAKKCNGLPLALVLLGAYLSKNLCLDTWLKMDHCLDWQMTKKWDIMEQILARSYHDMPEQHLKYCFLYAASFPEEYEISSSAITKLWIAEGFVPHITKHTLEETSRYYLEELVQRCMFHVVKRSKAHGWIEVFQIHDVLRDWAIQEALREGLLSVCKNRDNLLMLASGAMTAYRVAFHDFFDDEIYRVSPNLRTMFGFNLSVGTLHTLKFLRALYLEKSNLEKFSRNLGSLIHLRYIGLRYCKNVTLPSSVGCLLNLQYIILRGTRLPYIPSSFWNIPALRYVWFSDVKKWTAPRGGQQKELQTLVIQRKDQTRVSKYIWRRMRESLMHMTHITSLGIGGANVPVEMLTCLSDHDYLVELYLRALVGLVKLPDSRLFPQKLRTLTLVTGSDSVLEEDPMLTLGKLPNLVELTLAVAKYEGHSMSSSNCGFPRLQYLKLWWISAEKLRFEQGTMPKLITMTLEQCGSMARLPDGLLNLPSLSELKLVDMGNFLTRKSCEELENKGCKLIVTKGEQI
ncbi:hypothetical protein ABZP36_009899 [Zizania latifolia]